MALLGKSAKSHLFDLYLTGNDFIIDEGSNSALGGFHAMHIMDFFLIFSVAICSEHPKYVRFR